MTAGGVDAHNLLLHLSGPRWDGIERSPVEHHCVGDTVTRIEEQQPQFFLIQAVKRDEGLAQKIFRSTRK